MPSSVASRRRVVMRDLTIELVPWELTFYDGLELLRRHLQRRNLAGRREST